MHLHLFRRALAAENIMRTISTERLCQDIIIKKYIELFPFAKKDNNPQKEIFY